MPHPPRRTFQARYLFPVDAQVIPDGCLTIEGSRIVAVVPRGEASSPIDLGNVAILPGLVNAHTHLEYSDLTAPLGRPDNNFADWLRVVVGFRRQNQRDVPASAQLGLRESEHAGVAALGEIATTGWSAELFAASPLDVTAFGEIINLADALIEPKLAAAAAHLACSPTSPAGWLTGISPHAPYTVHQTLFTRLVDLAERCCAPLAMHLAESPEELELLATGDGPLRDLLDDMGVWNPSAIATGSRPLDYLRQLVRLPRSLVAHGNYLDAEEIAFAGQHADRLSIVYCPRTHAYFGHEPYPLAQLLAAGACIALGTDSRASNPDLNLLAEIRHVAHHHGISPAKALELGTLSGARALGIERDFGSLSVGKRTGLAVVQLPEHTAADPHELLLDEEAKAVRMIW